MLLPRLQFGARYPNGAHASAFSVALHSAQRLARMCVWAINVGQSAGASKCLLRDQGVNNYVLNTCLKQRQHPSYKEQGDRATERERGREGEKFILNYFASANLEKFRADAANSTAGCLLIEAHIFRRNKCQAVPLSRQNRSAPQGACRGGPQQTEKTRPEGQQTLCIGHENYLFTNKANLEYAARQRGGN